MGRQFIQEAIDLFNDTKGRKVSGDILTHEWKSSEIWEHFDLINYRFTDPDKMPMLILTSVEHFGNKEEAKQFLLECYKSYLETALQHTVKLQKAIEAEITTATNLLEDLEGIKSYFNA